MRSNPLKSVRDFQSLRKVLRDKAFTAITNSNLNPRDNGKNIHFYWSHMIEFEYISQYKFADVIYYWSVYGMVIIFVATCIFERVTNNTNMQFLCIRGSAIV